MQNSHKAPNGTGTCVRDLNAVLCRPWRACESVCRMPVGWALRKALLQWDTSILNLCSQVCNWMKPWREVSSNPWPLVYFLRSGWKSSEWFISHCLYHILALVSCASQACLCRSSWAWLKNCRRDIQEAQERGEGNGSWIVTNALPSSQVSPQPGLFFLLFSCPLCRSLLHMIKLSI